jgi:Protein of unknown function (DUF1559)
VTLNLQPAQTDIPTFYCPTRRSTMNIAKYNNVRRVDFYQPGTIAWSRGGNDYGGCIGAGIGWYVYTIPMPTTASSIPGAGGGTVPDVGTFELTQAQLSYEQTINPTEYYIPTGTVLGVFSINRAMGFRDMSNGTSNVIMIGEVQRLNGISPFQLTGTGSTNQTLEPQTISSDGWAWGGAATLFSTLNPPNKTFTFDTPGSDHTGGIFQVGLGDGSCRPISQNINLTTFNNLGCMASGVPVTNWNIE